MTHDPRVMYLGPPASSQRSWYIGRKGRQKGRRTIRFGLSRFSKGCHQSRFIYREPRTQERQGRRGLGRRRESGGRNKVVRVVTKVLFVG